MRVFITFFSTFCIFAQFGFASPVCKDIDKYEKFLANIVTMETNFVQKVNSKEHSGGIFLLKRPGKMLVDYNTGEINAVVGVNGGLITYLDKELEQISHLPKDKAPVHFILDSKQKLSEMNVTSCDESTSSFSVHFKQKTNVVSGYFTITFNKESGLIERISVLYPNNDKIDLLFGKVKVNEGISDVRFIIKDPRL